MSGFVSRRRGWFARLGLTARPWLILGSGPAPTLPRELLGTHARIDINNAGRTAQALGLGRADLTIRAKRKSWVEHTRLDTRGLLWIHDWPAPVLRLILATKPHAHVGTVRPIAKRDRDGLVAEISGIALEGVGAWGKVTNGVAAICLGLALGAPRIVVAGMSLSKAGHSYDGLGRARRQVDEDRIVLEALSARPNLFTTEPDLAEEAGLRLLTNESN